LDASVLQLNINDFQKGLFSWVTACLT